MFECVHIDTWEVHILAVNLEQSGEHTQILTLLKWSPNQTVYPTLGNCCELLQVC